MNYITISILFSLILPLSVSGAANTCSSPAGVDHTCKSIARPSIPYDYCHSTLSHAHPHPNSLGLPSLAAAAANLAIHHAESTENRIDDLRALERDHGVRAKYDACHAAYNEVAEALRDAVDAIHQQQYRKASGMMARAASSSSGVGFDTCDKAWGIGEQRPVVTLADAEYKRLAELAVAIVDLVEK